MYIASRDASRVGLWALRPTNPQLQLYFCIHFCSSGWKMNCTWALMRHSGLPACTPNRITSIYSSECKMISKHLIVNLGKKKKTIRLREKKDKTWTINVNCLTKDVREPQMKEKDGKRRYNK